MSDTAIDEANLPLLREVQKVRKGYELRTFSHFPHFARRGDRTSANYTRAQRYE